MARQLLMDEAMKTETHNQHITAMKTKVIYAATTAFFMFTFGQVCAQLFLEETKITPPVFPANTNEVHGTIATSINTYLVANVGFPTHSTRNHWAGTEVIRFEVSEKGNLTSFQVISSISPEIDSEVLRVLETTSGEWIPGTIDGKPYPMSREVSIVFKPYSGFDLVKTTRELQEKGNEILFVKKNPKRALNYYNRAAKLLPYEESILAGRCLCKYRLGDEEGYKEDLERILAIHPETFGSSVSGSPEQSLVQLSVLAMQVSISE